MVGNRDLPCWQAMAMYGPLQYPRSLSTAKQGDNVLGTVHLSVLACRKGNYLPIWMKLFQKNSKF